VVWNASTPPAGSDVIEPGAPISKPRTVSFSRLSGAGARSHTSMSFAIVHAAPESAIARSHAWSEARVIDRW
jgi:hypothetical protein